MNIQSFRCVTDGVLALQATVKIQERANHILAVEGTYSYTLYTVMGNL